VVDVDVDELHDILVIDLAQELKPQMAKAVWEILHSYVARVW
jgi:hypothetical protein